MPSTISMDFPGEYPTGDLTLPEYHRLVAEHVSDIISVHDKDGNFEFVSPSARQIVGFDPSELVRQSPYEFIHPADTDAIVRPIHANLLDKQTSLFRCRFRHKEGHYVWLEVTNDFITDSDSNVVRLTTSARDITLRKDLEDRLENLNLELREKNKKLEGLNKDLEEFAYIASHDLKEPLRNVVGLVQLLRDSADNKLGAEESEIMEMIGTASSRMTRMIESLLDYSRTGYPTEPVAEIRIVDVVESIRKDFSQVIARKKASLNYLGRDMTICGYPTAFHRLLQNLISNSLKHGREYAPRIEVIATEHRHNWKVSVKDDGPGIPQRDQRHIFKLFNRASSSPDSNGIGLALCKRISELHRGRIGVSSVEGNGTTFHISLSKNLDNES